MSLSCSGVYVFGDSLVDPGNALKLAETYDSLPFTSLPEGAPTAAKGYYKGRFTDGYTFADLLSNKFVGVPTKPVFPFGYEDPFLGISFKFLSDPSGKNLNFAYGGAQIRKGDEAVPDMGDQTAAFDDAVDGHADPMRSTSAPLALTTCMTSCRKAAPGSTKLRQSPSSSGMRTSGSRRSTSSLRWARRMCSGSESPTSASNLNTTALPTKPRGERWRRIMRRSSTS